MYPGQQYRDQFPQQPQQQPPPPPTSGMPQPDQYFNNMPQPYAQPVPPQHPHPPRHQHSYNPNPNPPPPPPYHPQQPPPQQQQSLQQPIAPGTYSWNSPQYHPSGFTSACNGRKKALLIGINYKGQRGELKGCINDVQNVKNFLITRHNFSHSPQTMVILTDDQRDPNFQPTRQNIINAIGWLVSGLAPGDSLFLHYSGHGGTVADKDGDELEDQTIFPVDHSRAGQITDDELNARICKMIPPGVRLTALFDCCHSGSVLDLPFMYKPDGSLHVEDPKKEAGKLLLNAGLSALTRNPVGGLMSLGRAFKALTTDTTAHRQKTVMTRGTAGDVLMLSGCRDGETSADTYIQSVGSTGAMSFAFLKVLSENPRQTYASLLQNCRTVLRGKYSQVPQLSSGKLMDMNQPFML